MWKKWNEPASIEAARAGEAGKGFAVVASKVGNLANSTKQNEFFHNVFKGIQEMIQMLHYSMEDIGTMGDAHNRQAEVIKGTITISQDIAENIRQENQEFSNINDMVDSNANDMMDMARQVSVINSMVDKINELLKK